jgi:hypothetical protein
LIILHLWPFEHSALDWQTWYRRVPPPPQVLRQAAISGAPLPPGVTQQTPPGQFAVPVHE